MQYVQDLATRGYNGQASIPCLQPTKPHPIGPWTLPPPEKKQFTQPPRSFPQTPPGTPPVGPDRPASKRPATPPVIQYVPVPMRPPPRHRDRSRRTLPSPAASPWRTPDPARRPRPAAPHPPPRSTPSDNPAPLRGTPREEETPPSRKGLDPSDDYASPGPRSRPMVPGPMDDHAPAPPLPLPGPAPLRFLDSHASKKAPRVWHLPPAPNSFLALPGIAQPITSPNRQGEPAGDTHRATPANDQQLPPRTEPQIGHPNTFLDGPWAGHLLAPWKEQPQNHRTGSFTRFISPTPAQHAPSWHARLPQTGPVQSEMGSGFRSLADVSGLASRYVGPNRPEHHPGVFLAWPSAPGTNQGFAFAAKWAHPASPLPAPFSHQSLPNGPPVTSTGPLAWRDANEPGLREGQGSLLRSLLQTRSTGGPSPFSKWTNPERQTLGHVVGPGRDGRHAWPSFDKRIPTMDHPVAPFSSFEPSQIVRGPPSMDAPMAVKPRRAPADKENTLLPVKAPRAWRPATLRPIDAPPRRILSSVRLQAAPALADVEVRIGTVIVSPAPRASTPPRTPGTRFDSYEPLRRSRPWRPEEACS